MKKLIVITLSALVMATLAAPPAWAHHMLDGKYHWLKPTTGELEISVHVDHLTWKQEFVDARKEWGSRTEFDFKSSSVSDCNIDYSFGTLTVCDDNYGNTGWGGIADIVVDSANHIQAGRVRLNTYYSWTYGTARSTWCQEIGHVMGLDHRGTTGTAQDDPDSCMSYNPNFPEYPDGHDIDQANCETIGPGEPEPNPDCTPKSPPSDGSGSTGGSGGSGSGSGGNGSCLLGIVCIDGGSDSVTPLSNGDLLLHLFAPPPIRVLSMPSRALW